VGAPLARIEVQAALTALARRLHEPRLLADPPPYRPNAVLRGPQRLPVEFAGITDRASHTVQRLLVHASEASTLDACSGLLDDDITPDSVEQHEPGAVIAG
jgi:hypothetical protein